MKKTPSQERLREIIWDVGQRYPIHHEGDSIDLLMVNPLQGHVTWHVRQQAIGDAKAKAGAAFSNASLIVRINDVTDVIFDGSNAHRSFDLEVGKSSGNYYFTVDRQGRYYLAEIGLRNSQGMFSSIRRSNAAYFDLDRPSRNYRPTGLFVGNALKRIFTVESIFDAPAYERMNSELAYIARAKTFALGVVFSGNRHASDFGSPLSHFIAHLSKRIEDFGVDVRFFMSPFDIARMSEEPLLDAADTLSECLLKEVVEAQRQRPFHIIHCHDWYTSAVGLSLKKEFNIPMVLTLHSTEHERLQGNEMNSLSLAVCHREKEAVAGSDLIIVPHSSTRQQVITLYEAVPEKVVIVADVFNEKSLRSSQSAAEVRGWFGLSREAPTVLFAGEISHAAGADILVDAIPTVCGKHSTVQFILAGDGPLRVELEARIHHAGISHRCRFLGDVSKETFDSILGASDFVVIPARTWQDEGLAQASIARGLPVLTTRQAGINCVVHGENGLVTFDNPGSIVWGVQEILHNPPKGSALSLRARKRSGDTPSLETTAVQHYMHYEMILRKLEGTQDA